MVALVVVFFLEVALACTDFDGILFIVVAFWLAVSVACAAAWCPLDSGGQSQCR
jgi:hypothetical protein